MNTTKMTRATDEVPSSSSMVMKKNNNMTNSTVGSSTSNTSSSTSSGSSTNGAHHRHGSPPSQSHANNSSITTNNNSSSSPSKSSKQELKARLQAMRNSVGEKQRHVSSLFFGSNDNNDNNAASNDRRLVFSIFDTCDSESEDVSVSGSSCISGASSLSPGKQQQRHQLASLLGTYSEEQGTTTTRNRTTSPTISNTTTRSSSQHISSQDSSSSSNLVVDDVESSSGCIGFYTEEDRSEDACGGFEIQSTGSISTRAIEDGLMRGSSIRNEKQMNKNTNKVTPLTSNGEVMVVGTTNMQQQHQRHAPRSVALTVPTGHGNDNDPTPPQQQQQLVGKSNRKSLLANCCCWGGNSNKERSNNPDDYYDEHLGEGRQYWRDIILGVNDGLVSTFLLIAGVTGANLSSTDILLTALSGTIAGAISMSAGEYVATKTQQEVMDGEIALERKHIAKNRDMELLELKEAFGIIGIPEDDNSEEVVNLRQHLMNFYAKNDEAHVKVHAVLELGVVEEEQRNPFIAGGVAFFLFFFGAMPSVIPFLCTSNIEAAFIAAAICTTMALLLVGVIKTWATRGNLWLASMENLLIAAGGGCIAYGVGAGFEKLVNG